MKIGLIGATNAGKSTLFNRLIGQFRAIVTDIHGTTIDILSHTLEVDRLGKITFYDSPGLGDFSDELPFIEKIVKNSDFLLFVIDVVNKLDIKRKVNEIDLAIADYYAL